MKRSLKTIFPPDGNVIVKKGEGEDEQIQELVRTEDQQGFSLSLIRSLRAKPHIHKTITETYVVVKGRVMVEINGTVRTLKAGGTLKIEPGTLHWVVVATQNSRFFCFCFPGFDPKDLVVVNRYEWLRDKLVRDIRACERNVSVKVRAGKRNSTLYVTPSNFYIAQRLKALYEAIPLDLKGRIKVVLDKDSTSKSRSLSRRSTGRLTG